MSETPQQEWPVLLNEAEGYMHAQHAKELSQTFVQYVRERYDRERHDASGNFNLRRAVLVMMVFWNAFVILVALVTADAPSLLQYLLFGVVLPVVSVPTLLLLGWRMDFGSMKEPVFDKVAYAIAHAFEAKTELFVEATELLNRRKLLEETYIRLTFITKTEPAFLEVDSRPNQIIDDLLHLLEGRLDAIYARWCVLAAEQQALIRAYTSPPAHPPTLPAPHAADRA